MSDISSALSLNQRVAVFVGFQWIAAWVGMDISENGEIPGQTLDRLKNNATLLEIDIESPLLKVFDGDGAEELLLDIINSIPSSLKPWFVVETYMILSSPSAITRRAMQVTLMYCEKIGITDKEYSEIIEAAYKLTGDYREGMF